MVAPGNPLGLRGLDDLARLVQTRQTGGPPLFVHRQNGSGTRLLTEHLLLQQGLDGHALGEPGETAEDSHGAVAAAVASGLGETGLGLESAALAFGLGFVPLIEEDYFLVCLADALEHPAVVQLRELLKSAGWRRSVADLPGYEPSSSGEVLSLTRALPWWNFRAPKAVAS
jgi:putative molybdopterin biosynthesis protein